MDHEPGMARIAFTFGAPSSSFMKSVIVLSIGARGAVFIFQSRLLKATKWPPFFSSLSRLGRFFGRRLRLRRTP